MAQEKIEAVKSEDTGGWIGKYYPGETQINRDGDKVEVVYYTQRRTDTVGEAIGDAIAIKNRHTLSSEESQKQFERDGF